MSQLPLRKAMAKPDAEKKPVEAKLPSAATKPTVTEEVVISSSDESDSDGDRDTVVPADSKDIKKISIIGDASTGKFGSPSITPLKREGMMQQPGMIRAAPGTSQFALGQGIKQLSASLMQQAKNKTKGPASGVPMKVTPLFKAHQARLNTAALKGVPAVSGSHKRIAHMSRAPPASSVGQADQVKTPLQQLHYNQKSFTASAMHQMEKLLYYQGRGGPSGTVPGRKNRAAAAAAAAAAQLEENFMEEEENMGVAETYAEYMPSKLKLGRMHPDPVVETASLSSVPPPDVWYTLSLPDDTIDNCLLSALQLEAVTYACQQHYQTLPDGSRAGYLIGDGAGVGKGRTVSGIIYENYLMGRKKAIWVSISSDLRFDAERDLRDIGAGKIPVYPLNKMKYAKISADVNGGVEKGVIFSTYSSLIGESHSGGEYRTRLKQLLQWCGEDFDGVIVFDECHRAKNLEQAGSLKPTKTGLTVRELQDKLPKARIVYASATGASEPRNMAYMVRLGLWGEGTPFRVFKDFLKAIENRGVGAMEMVAMEMKLRGMYIARQLSFKDVTFQVDEVSLPPKFIKVYDDSVKLWVLLFQSFTEAIDLMDVDPMAVWPQFWSAHQRFFKYLCIAVKVKHAVKVAREAVESGKCIVIGLQSTGEARTLEQIGNEGELSDFVSTAKGVLQSLVEKYFPAPNRPKSLLGLNKGLDQLGIDNETGGTSTGKRKAIQEAAERTKKRPRAANLDSDEESSEVEDSDFEADDDESGDTSEDLEANDFNPFAGGDSETEDPQSRSSNNAAKPKKGKKKKPIISVKAKKVDSFNDFEAEDKSSQPKKNDGSSGQLSQAALDKATRLKDKLLAQIEQLGSQLPPNTLDQLIDELGGPENVAEMTGRKGRVVQNDNGQVEYVPRSEADIPLDMLNITEKDRFMAGVKNMAIISEAASSGISLQADRRVQNQRRRVHITLELPWSADRAIQQFGRTHRSNQVSAPEYVFLISDLAGERRFASIVAKRLESLGALTHGDRRATETRDLSQFHIDNKYGRAALDATMKAVIGSEAALVPPPTDYKGDFFKDLTEALVDVGLIVQSEKNPGELVPAKLLDIRKFLNRILGVPVDLQNRLFQYFTDTLATIVTTAKKAGRYDPGILDLGTEEAKIHRSHLYTFMTNPGKIELHSFDVERGMSWDEAKSKWPLLFNAHEGFYISKDNRFLNAKPTPTLVVEGTVARRGADKGEKLYTIIRPNSGYQLRQEPLAEVKRKGRKVQPDEAEPHWNALFNATKSKCLHAFQSGTCRQATLGIRCQYGLRKQTYNVLTGSVLSVWTKVESVLKSHYGGRMQVVRLRSGGMRIVGTVVPHSCMAGLVKILTEEAQTVSEEIFPQE